MSGSDLSRVQVLRTEGQTRRTIMADVASTLRDGSTTSLPELRPGDTVVVPLGMGVDPLAAMGGGAAVLGFVTRPGLYPVGQGQDIWTVLAAAGGLTPVGDLGNIRILTREGTRQSALKANLKDVLNSGSKAPLIVREGDVVYVPSTAASTIGRSLSAFAYVVTVANDLFETLVLYQIYQNEKARDEAVP
jgi:protein involved in polysaccharide export with SLBB domain